MALELVKKGGRKRVSAGNTGALMGLAKLLLKPIEGIERPALVTVLPHQQKGKTGRGAGSRRQRRLRQHDAGAVRGNGRGAGEEVVGIANPRVALLNIGEEADAKARQHPRCCRSAQNAAFPQLHRLS